MSAFTLGTDHIDLLVTVAMKIPGWNEKYINIPKTADLLGQELLNECYKSVNYRYESHGEPETVPEYHWTPVAELQQENLSALLLLQVLNAAHCYAYQSCEHPDWTDSKSFWVNEAIENWAELKLTELKWPKTRSYHGDTNPPRFNAPAYMAWEWTREKGLDFEAMEQNLNRRL